MSQLETTNKNKLVEPSKNEPDSILRESWKKFKRNKLALLGVVIILIIILTAIFANFIAPGGYRAQDLSNALQPPSMDHWFGTDEFGRDVFNRVVYGTRTSLLVGFFAVTGALIVGSMLGIIAGYYGRWVDILISRVFDIMLSFPAILLAIAIVAALGPSLINVLIAVGIIEIPVFGRLIRSMVLSIKEEEYVMAARSVGMKDSRILLFHILPNSLTSIIVQGTLSFALAILSAAALGFLGLGAQPPQPEWGKMLSDSQQYIQAAPWTVFFPGLAIMLIIISLNLIGDGLRDALDPKMDG